MNTRELLDIAVSTGKIILQNGGEIYRVEEAISIICQAHELEFHVFAVPTGIFVSGKRNGEEEITMVRRIFKQSVNYNKFEKANNLARMLANKGVNYLEASKMLKEIEQIKDYGFFTSMLSAGAFCFWFLFLFNGTIREATAVFFISMTVYGFLNIFISGKFFTFFEVFFSCFVGSILCILAQKIFHYPDVYRLMMGYLFLFVPGGAIGELFKEAMYGHTLSSIYKIADAFFTAMAMCLGVIIPVIIFNV